MNSLWLLTQKNLKVLLRAKGSSLVVILAPLLIILILGFIYNNSDQYGIKVGIYSSSSNGEVEAFVNLLEEDNFIIQSYPPSPAGIDSCIKDIKSGLVHTCIDLPESLNLEGNSPAEVTFHVDPTRINLVWMIQETVGSKFNLKSQQISQELAQGIIDVLSETKDQINEKKSLLETIKQHSSAASSSTASIKESLSNLDLSSPAVSYANDPTAKINSAITESLESITEAQQKLENLTGSDKDEVTTLLGRAEDDLQAASKFVSGNASGSLDSFLIQLKMGLDQAVIKLKTTSEVVSSANSNFDSLTGTLSDSVAAMNDLDNSLNEIISQLESVQTTDAKTISSPLSIRINKVSEESTYLNYLFPALLILVVMFSSLMLGTTLVMMEKNSIAFLRNFFLPLRKISFIASIYLTNLILIVIEIVIILLISLFFLPGNLSQFPALALVLFLASSIFTFLGMGLGYLFTSEETGSLASISLGSIFLFLSGLILPLEGMSGPVRQFLMFNPFIIAENLVREIFLFNTPLGDLWIDILLLAGYSLVLFLIILVAESVLHKNLVKRFRKHYHHKHHETKKTV